MLNCAPDPVPTTSSWLAWLADVVTENQRSLPCTVMDATSSTSAGTGTATADHWSDETGERSRVTAEQLPFWHKPTRANA